MLVNLAKDWFGPDASLHMVVNNPHDFPDDWEIPGSAKKVEEKSSIDDLLDDDEKVITSKKK